ncbi:MAG: hypothetical protein IJZ96_05935 [Lachnospiraceae bacterium]|nr:hypothetical protein [Lachnospiraceae bacterium]MBQ8166555.1 hypothetical protein [Lachnospiraceae bacterium]
MMLNIAWIYPDILNLHGDRGNMMAIARIAEAMGLDARITKVNYGDSIDFDNTDLIFMGAGQIRDMSHVVKGISADKDAFLSYVEKGGYVLCIGSTGCALGKKLTQENGELLEGLGILDITAKELNRTKMPYVTKEVYGDDIWWTYNNMEILGNQIQRVDYTLGDVKPLGQVMYGYGNNLGGEEGARFKNVLLTNTVGPLLSANPWFGAALISEIMKAKDEDVSIDLGNLEYLEYAKEAAELKKRFIKDKFKLPGIIHNV